MNIIYTIKLGKYFKANKFRNKNAECRMKRLELQAGGWRSETGGRRIGKRGKR